MRLPRLLPRAYERLTLVSVVALGFIIVTGAGVRLTGSGLGCPDWPTCAQGHVVAPIHYHALVEFVNRTVTGLVSVVVILAVLGSLVRSPRRRDLTRLSLGLVAGVVGQILLGGLTVLYKLEPPFVMAHFLLSMVLLADAVILHHRAGTGDGRLHSVVDRRLRIMGRLIVGLVLAVVTAGTVVTSSGPHGGDANAPRWHLSLHRVTQVHGALAMLLVALVVGAMALARSTSAPTDVRWRAQLLLEALAAQVAVGYAQYFTGVPVLLVAFHILGAVLVWTAALRFNLSLSAPQLALLPTGGHRADQGAASPTAVEGDSVLTDA
jgi:cytochrome c oxidase assembly protein subunit 15